MSNPIRTVVSQDVTTMATDTPLYVIMKGSLENTYQSFSATSWSDSNVQFAITTPNPETVVDRRCYFGFPIQLTFVGNTGDVNVPLLNYGLTDSFKPFPLQSVISTFSTTINNLTLSTPTNDLYPWLFKYNSTQKNEYGYYSQSPSYLDQAQTYEELVGSDRNPMGGYPNSSTPYHPKRGEFPVWINTNTSTLAVVIAYIVEPIFMAPFLFKQEREPGFYGVQNLTFSITLDNNLSKIWSHAQSPNFNNAFTSVTVTTQGIPMPSPFPASPTLYLRYCTPNLTMPLNIARYNAYFAVDRYTNIIGAINGRSNFTMRTQNIQLNAIPRRLYIFARRQNSDITYSTPLVTSGITGLNITFGNRSGLLASASQHDLFQMALKNGYHGSWNDWLGYAGALVKNAGTGLYDYTSTCGAIACIDFGEDIGLPIEQAPGMGGTYQLQVDIQGFNPATTQINYMLYLVIIQDGIFFTQNTQAYSSIGNVTPGDLSRTENIEIRAVKHNNLYGSGFVDSLKKFASKASDVLGYVQPYAQMIHPGLGMATTGAQQIARAISGGRRKYRGGELMNLSDLKRRAQLMEE